jgi:predicted nucleic acid-binding protein
VIVAFALVAGCRVLYSKDMQEGQLIENQLQVVNPFIKKFEAKKSPGQFFLSPV